MSRSLAVALVLAAVAAGGAYAMPFKRADRNNDGFVDLEEAGRVYPSFTQAQFRRLDLDRDGLLGRGEYQQLINVYDVLVRPN